MVGNRDGARSVGAMFVRKRIVDTWRFQYEGRKREVCAEAKTPILGGIILNTLSQNVILVVYLFSGLMLWDMMVDYVQKRSMEWLVNEVISNV